MRARGFKLTLVLAGLTLLSSCATPAKTSSDSTTTSAPETYHYEEKDMYEKFWEKGTVHNETLALAEGEDAVISGSLFYVPTRIISVRDYTLQEEYAEGKDYRVEGQKIIRLEGSKIPYYTRKNMTGEEVPTDYGISTYKANEAGTKQIMFTEGAGIVMHQIAVTYEHDDLWPFDAPAYQGDKLPALSQKLKEGGTESIVFFGDSIMTGANASGKLGIEPFQDLYPDAVTKLLQERHPNVTFSMRNTSYGGWLSKDGFSNIDDGVNQYHPDLVFLGFGMNDGSWKIPAEDYVDNIDMMIRSIRARTPSAEIVVAATILPNPDSIQNQLQASYLAPLQEEVAKYTGVVLLDMTTYSQHLFTRKRSVDMLANNINHPSDFLARQYVSNILTLLDKDF
jgi:lysophospholipase L1-like esterase